MSSFMVELFMLVPCPLLHLEISPGGQDGERSSTNATKIVPVPGDFMEGWPRKDANFRGFYFTTRLGVEITSNNFSSGYCPGTDTANFEFTPLQPPPASIAARVTLAYTQLKKSN